MPADSGALSSLNHDIESMRGAMVETMSEMIGIRAVSPASGGAGESRRADFLEQTLKSWGLEVKRYDYKDDTSTMRSNLVSKLGERDRTLWIVVHMDTVAEGDLALWTHDPFKAHVDGDRIFGRGTNDNGEALIGAMFALKALSSSRAKMKYNYGLVIVADEELGSKFGIQKLIEEGIFSKNDMFLVPDSNTKEGNEIEVAEKSILWMKITVHGEQVHASTPEKGVNAGMHAARLMVALDEFLHRKYNAKSEAFEPPGSTFEMTKHEKNVDSINIIPGKEVFYVDSRILPDYRTNDVIADMKRIASGRRFKKVKVELEPVQQEDAPMPTDTKSAVFVALSGAIRSQVKIKPKAVGIGGGTCAAFFRGQGWPSVVWGIGEDIAHQPNEFAYISDIVTCAKVFAAMFVR